MATSLGTSTSGLVRSTERRDLLLRLRFLYWTPVARPPARIMTAIGEDV